MEKYKITKFGDKYKCQVRTIRYVIEFQDYNLNGQMGYELKFYLQDRMPKNKYHKLKALTIPETLSLINSIGDFALQYGYDNDLDFLVFKSPGLEIGDDLEFPDNVRTRFFVRWFNRKVGKESVFIDENRVIIRLK